MAAGNQSGLNERALIADIFAPLAANTPGALNLKDDAACLVPPAGKDLVITTDAIVADVHFFSCDAADTIAAKALRVNLSDLAAKGAEPLGYTLCLALNEGCTYEWVRNFASGLQRDQLTYGISLFGGDTVKTPGPLSVAITAFGTVEKGAMIEREGAQTGDIVYVSGTIGDGAFGLDVTRGLYGGLGDAQKEFLRQRYRCPEPRCALVPALVQFASAAMDVSDGLIGDIGALCAVSGLSADITLEDIPLSPATRSLVCGDDSLLHRALNGGDDYEIICTVARDDAGAFEAVAKQCGVAVSKIGVITKGSHCPQIFDNNGKKITLLVGRYEH